LSLGKIEDILRTSLGEIKSSSLIDSYFCVPVVNHETSPQIEASKNTFACKDTGKAFSESVFFVLNCLQATLITGTIMMFPASCLNTQCTGMLPETCHDVLCLPAQIQMQIPTRCRYLLGADT